MVVSVFPRLCSLKSKVTPEMNPLAERVTSVPGSPSVKLNARVDKDHSSSVAGGLQVYRRRRGAATSAVKAWNKCSISQQFDWFDLRYSRADLPSPANCYFHLADFPKLSLTKNLRKCSTVLASMSLKVSQPSATISVAKGGQAVDTIVKENILKMRARCWGFQNAVWIANHDAYPQLAVGGDGNGSGNLYQNSISEDRPDTLVVLSFTASTLKPWVIKAISTCWICLSTSWASTKPWSLCLPFTFALLRMKRLSASTSPTMPVAGGALR